MTRIMLKDLKIAIEYEKYDEFLETWNYSDAWEIIEELLKDKGI